MKTTMELQKRYLVFINRDKVLLSARHLCKTSGSVCFEQRLAPSVATLTDAWFCSRGRRRLPAQPREKLKTVTEK